MTRLKIVFSFACFLLAIYYGITQVVRYLQNKDSSTVTYKIFNEMPDNRYPTFSICLKGKEIYWRNEPLLFEYTGVTSAQYIDVLKGRGWKYNYDKDTRLYKKEYLNETDVPKLDVPGTFLQPIDIIKGARFVSRNYSGEEDVDEIENSFYIGHRTADETCFTRNSYDKLRSIRIYDEVVLRESLLGPGSPRNLEIKIIVHYPGQLIRNIEKPSHYETLKEIWKTKKVLEEKVSEVSVLKNRPNARTPCYDGNLTDDARFRQKAIKLAGCVPNFWQDLDFENMNKRPCKTKKDFEELQHTIASYRKVSSNYKPSCISMDTSVIHSKSLRPGIQHITIRISYMADSYQETENVQDFGFESFFSSLGGFVGIFLGYSMLQIPELLSAIPSLAKRLKVLTLKGKLDTASV